MITHNPGPTAYCPKTILFILLVVISAHLAPAATLARADTGEAEEAIAIAVPVDIRPGLCPNHLRIESPLTLPVAIIGSLDFEIERIDPLSVRLTRDGFKAQLEPVRWAYADVGTPIVGGLCACHKLHGDGIDDLELHFSIQDIARSFDLAESSGRAVELTLTGRLVTGEPVSGSDCAEVLSGAFEDERNGGEICMLSRESADPDSGPFKFAYQTTVSDRVTFAIYDLKGQTVVVLNDMDMSPGIYTATWDGSGGDKEMVPAGIYFARVCNSLASDIMKITITREYPLRSGMGSTNVRNAPRRFSADRGALPSVLYTTHLTIPWN